NVVAKASLSCRLDLQLLTRQMRNATLAKNFCMAVVKLRSPPTTAMFFVSGKRVVTGARTVGESKVATRKVVKMVKKVGFPAVLEGWEVVNVVGAGSVGHLLDLPALDIEFDRIIRAGGEFEVHYSVELFPGLTCKVREVPRCSFVVFTSGKVNVMGAKSAEEVKERWEWFLPFL
ncbi:hypothetical protein K402DRAFT_298415, partial [Aulographum hederae CBS 113979]